MYEGQNWERVKNLIIELINQEQGKTISKTYQVLYSNNKVQKLLEGINAVKREQFKKRVKDKFKDNKQFVADQEGVKWIKQYPDITNKKQLRDFIQKKPEGFKVNLETLDKDTYYGAKEEIIEYTKFKDNRRLKKINTNNKNCFYLFPTTLEAEHKIQQVTKNTYFDTAKYLDICKEENFQLASNNKQETNDKNKMMKLKGGNWNSWVDGYKQLKQAWNRKNMKK